MNARQRHLVQASFKLLAPYADITAGLFYKRLFKYDPSLRQLFKGDPTDQNRKLASVLTILVEGLDDLDKILPAVEQLGRRHAHYGVLDEHYDTVGQALLWTLRQTLGPDFSPAVEEAWTTLYSLVADAMKEAATKELQSTASTAACAA